GRQRLASCIQLQRQQLHGRDRCTSAGSRVRYVAQLLRSSDTHPASRRERKIDGRLRAPVFLYRSRSRRHARYTPSQRISMKARQVALIAGLALSAAAHAQTASVTLYGRLNLDVEVVNGKQGGDGCPDNCPNPSQYRVSSNASMFGIRGVEPLGGG